MADDFQVKWSRVKIRRCSVDMFRSKVFWKILNIMILVQIQNGMKLQILERFTHAIYLLSLKKKR